MLFTTLRAGHDEEQDAARASRLGCTARAWVLISSDVHDRGFQVRRDLDGL